MSLLHPNLKWHSGNRPGNKYDAHLHTLISSQCIHSILMQRKCKPQYSIHLEEGYNGVSQSELRNSSHPALNIHQQVAREHKLLKSQTDREELGVFLMLAVRSSATWA